MAPKHQNKTKFVRNRDIKLSGSEIKKEQHIRQHMTDGVCFKCIEKLQWKFTYDKYKPLKHVATCQNCKNKVITKAYRTLCDKCALSKGECPSCCASMNEMNKLHEIIKKQKQAAITTQEENEDDEDRESKIINVNNERLDNIQNGILVKDKQSSISNNIEEDQEDEEDDEDDEESQAEAQENNSSQDDESDYEDIDIDCEKESINEDENDEETKFKATESNITETVFSNIASTNNINHNNSDKMTFGEFDNDYYTNVLKTKYSKNRKTGSQEDIIPNIYS